MFHMCVCVCGLRISHQNQVYFKRLGMYCVAVHVFCYYYFIVINLIFFSWLLKLGCVCVWNAVMFFNYTLTTINIQQKQQQLLKNEDWMNVIVVVIKKSLNKGNFEWKRPPNEEEAHKFEVFNCWFDKK